MPYAEGRVFFDADSHLMETEDWLVHYADPNIRSASVPSASTAATPQSRK